MGLGRSRGDKIIPMIVYCIMLLMVAAAALASNRRMIVLVKSLLRSSTARVLFVGAAISLNFSTISAASAAPSECRERAIAYCRELLPDVAAYGACVEEQVAFECSNPNPDCFLINGILVCYNT